MGQILLIDLEAALSSPADGMLEAVRRTAEDVGVIQVINHGVPADLLTDYWQRIERMFSRPWADRVAMASRGAHPYRDSNKPLDGFETLKIERYNIAQFDSPEEAKAAGVAPECLNLYSHPNVWPTEDPRMHDVTFRYIDAAVSLSERVLELYAKALNIPCGTFSLGAPPYVRFTINNYPLGHDDGDLLLPVHRDDSAMTILGQQGDYEGLRVELPDGSWMPVPVIPGALLAMSGTLLTRWTSGRLHAPRHYAVAGGTRERRSTSAFCFPGLHTVIRPLELREGSGDAAFEPFLVSDHTRARASRSVPGLHMPSRPLAAPGL
jgi:flavonol synthase